MRKVTNQSPVLLQPDGSELKTSVSQLSLTTPSSHRKKRRLRETLAQLTRETDASPFPPRKRPSAEHSLSIGSLLDISNTPESSTTNGGTAKLALFFFFLHSYREKCKRLSNCSY